MAASICALRAVSSWRLLLVLIFCGLSLEKAAFASLPHLSAGGALRRIPDEQRLYETIMETYQQSVRPHITNTSYTLTVAFSLRLNQIVSLDERKQVLTTNVFIDQTWIDPALAWDPDKFTDVRALRIPAEHVWLPDTFVYNNADGGTSGFMRGTYVQIQSNGRVLWPVPLRLRSSCSVQITYFPFDSQICTLRFGSWIYGLNQLDYQQLTDGLTVDPSTYVNNSEWELVSITMHKALSPAVGLGDLHRSGPHPHLTYVLHLKRNTFFYLFNIIVPCAMLSTLNILTFWLPPVSGEKITLGLSVFLAFSMFMLLIAEEVPATSEAVPLIGVYLCMVMTMTSLSVMMAVVVTNLYHRGRKMKPAPRWLVTACRHWLAKPLCVLNDVALIASAVDLAEHCQYDVYQHRKSQSRLVRLLNMRSTADAVPSLGANACSSLNPALLPVHLQNGGQASRSLRQDAYRQPAPVMETALAEEPPQSKGSALSSLFSSLGERKLARELHPRARNSVVRNCRFSKIPTSVEENEEVGDDFVDDKPDEEEEVWVRRDDISSSSGSSSDSNSSEMELGSLINDNSLKDDDEDIDGESEENEISASLLANSARVQASNPQEQIEHMGSSQTPKRAIKSSSTSSTKLYPNPQRPQRCSQENSCKKLDPHPSSSDLQSIRTLIAEWQQIATVVDRLMFLVYLLTTVTAYVIILVVVPANQPPVTDLMLDKAGVEYWIR